MRKLAAILPATLAAAAAVAAAGIAVVVSPATPALAGGGCHGPATEGAGTTVELSKACMAPTVLHVAAGTTVTFVNRDPIEHNVTGTAYAFNATLAAAGDRFDHRFDEAGTHPFTCTLHPGMNGAVVVGDVQLASAATPTAGTDNDADDNADGVPVPAAITISIVAAALAAAAGRFTASRRVPAAAPARPSPAG